MSARHGNQDFEADPNDLNHSAADEKPEVMLGPRLPPFWPEPEPQGRDSDETSVDLEELDDLKQAYSLLEGRHDWLADPIAYWKCNSKARPR